VRNVQERSKKVMWVGRATVFLVGLAVVLGLLFGLAATALAGTGVGAPFNLGQKNIVNAISRLVGKVDGPMLLVDNNSAGTKATTLTLNTEAGKSPMKVSSNAATATNLSADKFDGQDSTAFQKRVTGACATGQGSIVSINESGTVDCRAPLVLQGGDHTESQPPNGRGCTKEDTWTECGKVQVFVPAGETWTVAIDSGGSFFKWNAATRVRFCTSARRSTEAVAGSNCVNTPTAVTTNNEVVAAATNGWRTLDGGPSGRTWVISTLVYPDDPLDWYNGYDYVVLHTLVTVFR
jgi:hypothetical protein